MRLWGGRRNLFTSTQGFSSLIIEIFQSDGGIYFTRGLDPLQGSVLKRNLVSQNISLLCPGYTENADGKELSGIKRERQMKNELISHLKLHRVRESTMFFTHTFLQHAKEPRISSPSWLGNCVCTFTQLIRNFNRDISWQTPFSLP